MSGQLFWNNNGFPKTTFETELEKIIENKIKVHSYYLNPFGTKIFYEKLSKDTNGVSEEFKINDVDATKKFADFVADKILSNLGDMMGEQQKQKLLELYKNLSNKNVKKYV